MSIKVRQKSAGMDRLYRVLEQLETRPPKVTVGIHLAEGSEIHRGGRGLHVADVAAILEYGGEDRAPVPWLRSTVDARRTELERLLSNAGKRALRSAIYGTAASGHVERAFGRVAGRSERIVRRTLRKLDLVETGHLVESVRGKVDGRAPDADS